MTGNADAADAGSLRSMHSLGESAVIVRLVDGVGRSGDAAVAGALGWGGERTVFPAVVGRPCMPEIDDRARLGGGIEKCQRAADNGSLIVGVVGLSRGMPEWVVDKGGARRCDSSGD